MRKRFCYQLGNIVTVIKIKDVRLSRMAITCIVPYSVANTLIEAS